MHRMPIFMYVQSIRWQLNVSRRPLHRQKNTASSATTYLELISAIHFHINRGAGAFVCGEGSALTASIEGNRGMPRVKPPRTVEQGLVGETDSSEQRRNLCQRSDDHLPTEQTGIRGIGTAGSPGTKSICSLTGNVE